MMQKTGAHFATAVFDITYTCNDTCAFCFNKEMLNRDPAMSLSEIKKNYAYVKKKYGIRQVILSGGEPTLHPDIWRILDFFYNHTDTATALNTNSLTCTNPAVTTQLESLLSTAKNPKRYLSLSISTVDAYPPKTPLEKLKLAGVKKALEAAYRSRTKAVIVIIITKTNYQALPGIIADLLRHKRTHADLAPELTITLRGLFLDRYMTDTQKNSTVPTSWTVIKPYVLQSLRTLRRDTTVGVRLFGLPLCYFRDWRGLANLIPQMAPWWHEIRMRVSHKQQLSKIRAAPHLGEVWTQATCAQCSLNAICNKIQQEFLTEYNYPPLKHF